MRYFFNFAGAAVWRGLKNVEVVRQARHFLKRTSSFHDSQQHNLSTTFFEKKKGNISSLDYFIIYYTVY